MKKATLFFILPALLFCSIDLLAQQPEKYSRVKVYANTEQATKLLLKGVGMDELAARASNYFIGDFSSREIAIMKESKLKIEYVINDLTEDFLKRNRDAQQMGDINMRTGGTPPGFSYGSMGGYLTFNEMVAELDELKTMYPNLITTKSSIGTTAEGRSIWMVKISDNPDVNESQEDGVLYTGLTHGREPISMVSLIYYMQYILSRYATDPEMACLINNRELYFVPCVNPDGYVYNQTTNPSGGGYWRKNRRNNGDSTFGVDLNRNFNYYWGFDNTGSSNITSSEIYRGPSAGSELETVAIKNFVNANQLTIALNTHSYANKVILPYEYNSSTTPNEFHYNSVASMLTFENKYLYGKNMAMTGYNANGTADDWMYAVKQLYAFTVETGSDIDGFWPAQNRIIPICEQNLDLNISAAWDAGKYIKPRIAANTYVSGSSYNLPVLITNYGSMVGTSESIQLSIADSRVQSYNNTPISVNGLAIDSTLTALRNITFSPSATNGTINGNFVTTNSEGCTYNIPFSFEYSPNGCFSIPSSWTAVDIGSVGIAGSSCYQNGIYTVKGSGTGVNGTADQCHMMKLVTATNVTDIRAQVLTVQNTNSNARAGISISETSTPGSRRVSLFINPSNNSIVFQKRASTNGSITTMTVNNQGAVPKWLRITKGNSTDYVGYYSSNGVQWTSIGTHKKTNLPANVTAGIMVTSGTNSALHTATFSNLAVTTPGGIINRSSDAMNMDPEVMEDNELAVYPNPSKGIVEIRLPTAIEKQVISVFDMSGRELHREIATGNVKQMNLSHLSNGVYYIRITEGTRSQYEKFIINK
jgi:murein tripeptide amidase MpaA